MQKTSNYQLNQWEATDKLSRGDFNADNAAIDAALANKAEKSTIENVKKAMSTVYTPDNPPEECIIISTGANAAGDTLYTFEKEPRFAVIFGSWSSTVAINGRPCSMLDYHTYDTQYTITLRLDAAELKLISRGSVMAGNTMYLIPFY